MATSCEVQGDKHEPEAASSIPYSETPKANMKRDEVQDFVNVTDALEYPRIYWSATLLTSPELLLLWLS